jgi:hypothetical protein
MAGGCIWQIWLADAQKEHVAGVRILQICHGAQKENVTGRSILQIWLALRAWGLRPSTPRLAGARVLAVSEASRGLRPHTPGPSADADVSADPRRMRTWCQAKGPHPMSDTNVRVITTQIVRHTHGLGMPGSDASIDTQRARVACGLTLIKASESLARPRTRWTQGHPPGALPTYALLKRLHLPKARGCGGGAPDLLQRQRAHGPLPNAG